MDKRLSCLSLCSNRPLPSRPQNEKRSPPDEDTNRREAMIGRKQGGSPRKALIVPVLCCCAVYLLQPALLCAQESPSQPLTLNAAVDLALGNYPAIRAAHAQVAVARAGIDLARTAYLPRTDLLWQENRATRNNVFGLLLPQSVISSMSGPVLGSNNLGSVWGSAIGGLVTWEPFDFGSRGANVAVASAARAQTEAALKRIQFEVAVAAADAYLTLVAAQEI